MKNLSLLLFLFCVFITFGQNSAAQIPEITKEETAFADSIAQDWNFGKAISGGVINGKAHNLVKPVCPKDVNASGAVKVAVLIDENLKVAQAEAVSGNYWLYDSAEQAAKDSTFAPTNDVQPVKITGFIIYNFNCVSDAKTPKVISGGYLNSKATNLIQPQMPSGATTRWQGKLRVRILINSNGNVIEAKAVFGHPLLRAAAEQAARASKFSPSLENFKNVLVSGILTYDFPPKVEKKQFLGPCEGGVVNGIATYLPQPELPKNFKADAKGIVSVWVAIDKNGYVTEVRACSGHPLLRKPAEDAARKATFKPTIFSGVPRKVAGTIIYSFPSKPKSNVETFTSCTGGVLNEKAIYLPQPKYSAKIIKSKLQGSITVRIAVDENGNVVEAHACSKNLELKKIAEDAARKAKFKPTMLSGVAVKVTGIIGYNLPPKEYVEGSIKGNYLNNKAVYLPEPEYPKEKLKPNVIRSTVSVNVLIDENGNVIEADAFSGTYVFRESAENAARKAKFRPTFLDGKAVKTGGILVFDFSTFSSCGKRDTKMPSAFLLNGRATYLPKPEYPEEAKKVRASGAVSVQVLVDEEGNVISATAVSGHPLLRAEAEKVARMAKFEPFMRDCKFIKISGTLVYNFRTDEPCPPNPPPSISGNGILNGKAIYLPKPEYPQEAKKYDASGSVSVQVLVDEYGNVISATAVSGHPLLRSAAEKVAREAKFQKVFVDCKAVKHSGTLIYNFVLP